MVDGLRSVAAARPAYAGGTISTTRSPAARADDVRACCAAPLRAWPPIVRGVTARIAAHRIAAPAAIGVARVIGTIVRGSSADERAEASARTRARMYGRRLRRSARISSAVI